MEPLGTGQSDAPVKAAGASGVGSDAGPICTSGGLLLIGPSPAPPSPHNPSRGRDSRKAARLPRIDHTPPGANSRDFVGEPCIAIDGPCKWGEMGMRMRYRPAP